MAQGSPIPQPATPICWAEPLGGCSTEPSGEHILSKSTLDGPEITIRGFPFLQGKPLTLHKSQFQSNILCRKHNNELSRVDEAGTNAFDTLGDLAGAKPPRRKRIDGQLFERWLLKTPINMEMIATNFETRPPLELVERAFGKKCFPESAGLFSLGKVGSLILDESRVTYRRMMSDRPNANDIVGGRFSCHGFEFLLMLGGNVDPALALEFANEDGVVMDSVRPMHHPHRFNLGDSHFVAFSWRNPSRALSALNRTSTQSPSTR
jgi:hypothetical protein